jgi:hypothetical protein
MLTALLLIACSNLSTVPSFLPDGARQATGQAAGGAGDTALDTAGDTGAGEDTAVSSAAPRVTDAAAEGLTDPASGETFYRVTLTVEDAQDDLVGGKVFYDLLAGGSADTKTLTIKEAAGAGPSDAGWNGSVLVFGGGPIDLAQGPIVDAIVVRDAAGHESTPAAAEIVAAATGR